MNRSDYSMSWMEILQYELGYTYEEAEIIYIELIKEAQEGK